MYVLFIIHVCNAPKAVVKSSLAWRNSNKKKEQKNNYLRAAIAWVFGKARHLTPSAPHLFLGPHLTLYLNHVPFDILYRWYL